MKLFSLLFDLNIISLRNTDLKSTYHRNTPESPEPPRAETPPDLGEIKKDIIDQIKQHLDSRTTKNLINF